MQQEHMKFINNNGYKEHGAIKKRYLNSPYLYNHNEQNSCYLLSNDKYTYENEFLQNADQNQNPNKLQDILTPESNRLALNVSHKSTTHSNSINSINSIHQSNHNLQHQNQIRYAVIKSAFVGKSHRLTPNSHRRRNLSEDCNNEQRQSQTHDEYQIKRSQQKNEQFKQHQHSSKVRILSKNKFPPNFFQNDTQRCSSKDSSICNISIEDTKKSPSKIVYKFEEKQYSLSTVAQMNSHHCNQRGVYNNKKPFILNRQNNFSERNQQNQTDISNIEESPYFKFIQPNNNSNSPLIFPKIIKNNNMQIHQQILQQKIQACPTTQSPGQLNAKKINEKIKDIDRNTLFLKQISDQLNHIAFHDEHQQQQYQQNQNDFTKDKIDQQTVQQIIPKRIPDRGNQRLTFKLFINRMKKSSDHENLIQQNQQSKETRMAPKSILSSPSQDSGCKVKKRKNVTILDQKFSFNKENIQNNANCQVDKKAKKFCQVKNLHKIRSDPILSNNNNNEKNNKKSQTKKPLLEQSSESNHQLLNRPKITALSAIQQQQNQLEFSFAMRNNQ